MAEKKVSILEMARGAIIERVNYEMERVLDNIHDTNTKATAKRKITLSIELAPDDQREQIRVQVQAKSALAPTNPIMTQLYVAGDENGEMVVAEMVRQTPGQTSFEGEEQKDPKILKLAKKA